MRVPTALAEGHAGSRLAGDAVPPLITVLSEDDHVMVRHEAAEALGAIGDEAARPTLEKYLNDPAVEVAESCDVALDLLDWMQSKELEY